MKRINAVLFLLILIGAVGAGEATAQKGKRPPIRRVPNQASSERNILAESTTLPDNYRGELKDSVYRNDFLGLTLKLPDGWKAFNADEEAAAQEVGKQMLQKNDAAFNARLEAGENAAKSLLFVSKKAFGLPDNAALTIVLDPRFAALKNRFPLRQSAMATQTFLTKNSNVPLTVARSVYETKLGGLQTFSFELTGKSADGAAFRVTNYLLRRQNCTVIVTATGSSDADNALLSSILQTLTFTQTK